LNVLWENRSKGALKGTFTGPYHAEWYWSSTEYNYYNARNQRFRDGRPELARQEQHLIPAVRAGVGPGQAGWQTFRSASACPITEDVQKAWNYCGGKTLFIHVSP
jgi:hypothetical protein